MSSPTTPPVRRRRVFYIPGYDPIHPRRYRELYRKEGTAQAALSGYELALAPKELAPKELAPKQPTGRYGWQVKGHIDGQAVRADFEVLVWSDIVRDSMDQGILATYLELCRTAWIYIASGALFRLMRLRKGPVIAALYPVGFLLVQLVLALALLAGVVALGAWLGGVVGQGIWGNSAPGWPSWAATGLSAALGGLAFVWLLRWFKAKDGKFFAYYLMHDYAYSARHGGANPPLLEARMAEFTAEISAALQEDIDEVLVVGHSSGAHLAVSILSDLIRDGHVRDTGAVRGTGPVPENGPVLSFLSLGQVVPMVSFLPGAHRLRADLAFLSTRSDLCWVDVTAPGDGCAFALCDPVCVSGVATHDKRWPLVISAAFTQTLSPARWKELRWRFFRLHFQYMCAFDRPGDYDYFQITAGPQTLGARYAGRAPSRSRIENPVNRYISTSP